MKKILVKIAFAVAIIGLIGCSDNDEGGYRTYQVSVTLAAPIETATAALSATTTAVSDGGIDMSGILVTALNSSGTTTTALTDATGTANFTLTGGSYTFSASFTYAVDGVVKVCNFSTSAVISAETCVNGKYEQPIVVEPAVSQGSSQLIIKEIYTGGCQKDDGSGHYQFDKYLVVYNNSPVEANIKNFCVSNAGPYNANAGINNYVDGQLIYANEGYTPAHNYIFYLVKNFVLAPYTSATIVLNAAIDHTTTYSQSIDLSDADYVCYDPEDFGNTSYHPTPSATIPTENYFLASKYCLAGQNGTAWSMVSPALFIFSTGDNDPLAYSQSETNRYYFPGKESNAVYAGTKIPNEWILDAVDVWGADYIGLSFARYSSVLEAGYIYMTNKQGYSIYRNVDQEATEALAENEGKLVYGYSGKWDGAIAPDSAPSTDPSGIDAEASLKNGAHIVYKDTNNSTSDFHQRAKASLKE